MKSTLNMVFALTVMRLFLVMIILLPAFCCAAQQRMHVYLFPGQGSDYAVFSKTHLANVDTSIISYPVPLKKESLQQYAKRLSAQIDTTQPYCFVGVSFGGMNAVEISKLLKPQKVILISSAKCRKELPFRYKFQKAIPMYTIFSGRFYKRMANKARPIVEPDSRQYDSVFRAMINRKDKYFMKRSVKMICRWDNKIIPANVVHIHGSNDHTLPYRRIKNAIEVKKGSHMMVYTRADEINVLLNSEFK